MSIKYYHLAKDETPPEEFCAIRDVGGEPSEYMFYVPEAENAKLREDNDRLIQAIEDLHDVSLEDKLVQLENENDRLRELVRDYFNAPCLECNPWAEGWEGCKHCESGNCTLATRTLELGIEVDE